MEQTATRLRKSFHYPSENSDDDLPEALDEEEQSKLITTLQTQNTHSNTLYTNLFLALPLLCTLPYLTTLFSRTSTASTSLLSLLSISSLLSSAYILYYLPHGKTGMAWLDNLVFPSSAASKGESRERLPRLGDVIDKGPLELYLPYLNLVMAGLVLVAGVLVGSGGVARGKEELWRGYAFVPVVVYAVVLGVKVEMGRVDVGELEKLKYNYKGA